MTRLVLAELLKFRTTRTFWALAASALGLVLLIMILTLAIDHNLTSEEDVQSLLSTAGIYGLLTLILGVVAGAGEYRHGTIAWTLLVTPQRLRAVGGSVIVLVLIFVIDPVIAGLFENVGQFTLTGLGIAMTGGDNGDENVLPLGVAALVWALYTALFTALAVIFTSRRDI